MTAHWLVNLNICVTHTHTHTQGAEAIETMAAADAAELEHQMHQMQGSLEAASQAREQSIR